MPLYEYQCGACEHRFETIQKASEAPLADCPACAEPSLRKLLSAPNFRLKGSGWYETDFKTDGKKNLSDGGGADSSAAGTENGKSDSAGDAAGKSTTAAGDATAKPSPAADKSTSTGSAAAGGAATAGPRPGDKRKND